MKAVTDYTAHDYRDINRNLRNGIVTEQAAELVEVVSTLPALPGTVYRTFWIDDLDTFIGKLRTDKIQLDAFTSASRNRAVAERFNGNVEPN